jgi:hypothetical protein
MLHNVGPWSLVPYPEQGTLTERDGSVQLTSSLKVDSFVNMVNNIHNIKAAVVN